MNSKLLRAISFRKRRFHHHPSFFPHFDGYIWSFPRCDHLSVGICGSMASHNQTELRTHLQNFHRKTKTFHRSRLASQSRAAIAGKFRLFRSARLSAKIGHLLVMLPLS